MDGSCLLDLKDHSGDDHSSFGCKLLLVLVLPWELGSDDTVRQDPRVLTTCDQATGTATTRFDVTVVIGILVQKWQVLAIAPLVLTRDKKKRGATLIVWGENN